VIGNLVRNSRREPEASSQITNLNVRNETNVLKSSTINYEDSLEISPDAIKQLESNTKPPGQAGGPVDPFPPYDPPP
jgi:hypothetical protein